MIKQIYEHKFFAHIFVWRQVKPVYNFNEIFLGPIVEIRQADLILTSTDPLRAATTDIKC